MKYSGGENKALINLDMKDEVKFIWPLNYIFKPFRPIPHFHSILKFGILGFAVSNSVFSVFDLAFGTLNISSSYIITGFLGLSASVALVSYAFLYRVTEDLIEQYTPVSKFGCCLGVILLPVLQKCIFFKFLLAKNELLTGLESLLICSEMISLSICCFFYLSYKEYQDDMRPIYAPIKNSIKTSIKYLFTSKDKLQENLKL